MDTQATNDIADNYAGNPPVIEKPIGVVAENIHARILAEQQKLHAEEQNERELTAKRISLLTEGSDKDVDTCELAIDQSRSAQLRCLERIELLAEQLKQANRKAESQRLDEVAAGAQRARERATSLLRKYPKAAREVAALLAEVKTCESEITAANLILAEAARPTVESADPKRFSVYGNFGLVTNIVGLHELVNLPNEIDGQPAYWAPLDANAWIASSFSRGLPTVMGAAR